MSIAPLTFKIASEADEFDQIHRINYRTFVEEIPQHATNDEQLLVDRFHASNTYCIGLDGQRVVAMLAVRGERPFSLDEKLADLDQWLPPEASLCELRLLAVEKEYRNTAVFADLFRFAATECMRRGFTLGVASGTLRQRRLYDHMGFVPVGPVVGTDAAPYQPMYLSLGAALVLFEKLKFELPSPSRPVSFLPGPVEISPSVRDAFAAAAISHRSEAFVDMMAETRRLLCGLTRARCVAILVGTGTTANDAVAAQLRALDGSGIVLTNGEFGDRLIDHAERMQLRFDTMRTPWGARVDMQALESALDQRPDVRWIWTVHCETSSGTMNDLTRLATICRERRLRLAADCTSSLGTMPIDVSEVFLASSVSGKAIGAPAGLALVLYNESLTPDRRIPRALDLGYGERHDGVPFTHSSPLVAALRQALRELDPEKRFRTASRQKELIVRHLRANGIEPGREDDDSSPAILNIPLPLSVSSRLIGESLERHNFLVSYRSEYLLERNLMQICLMGHVTDDHCLGLAAALIRAIRDRSSVVLSG